MSPIQNSPPAGRTPKRFAMALAVVGLLLAILTPPRFGRFADIGAGIVVGLAAPLSHPLSRAARSINPARLRGVETEAESVLLNENSLLLKEISRLEFEREQLLGAITELQRARETSGWGAGFELHVAPVIAGSSDPSGPVLRVRAGTSSGVHVGDVAAATISASAGDTPGAVLVGRVTRSGPRLCDVVPIDAAGAGAFNAGIPNTSGLQIVSRLSPTGDGALTGTIAADLPVAVGDIVRLRDETWPAAAQGLAAGRIVSVDPIVDDLLRVRLRIEPEITLRNLARVTFWLDAEEGAP